MTDLIDQLLNVSLQSNLAALGKYLKQFGERSSWDKWQLARARAATITAISRYREEVVDVVSHLAVEGIEGRLGNILNVLNEKNIHVLPGGTIERYLPHFKGNEFELSQDAKREAILAEVDEMTGLTTDNDLALRYGDLYKTTLALPAKSNVDIDPVLRKRLSRYIHELQNIVVSNLDWDRNLIQARMNSDLPRSC